jgi:hypothetical protein
MEEFALKNRIQELKSYIASEWPGKEERKQMYQELAALEKELSEKGDD